MLTLKDADGAAMQFVVSVLIDDPSTDNVQEPYSACNQGFDAYSVFGLPIDVNPYSAGANRDWWAMGWQEAREQDESDGSSDTATIPATPTGCDQEPEEVEEGVEAFIACTLS